MEYLPEIHKTQWVRLYYDTLVLGPVMMWAARKYKKQMGPALSWFLFFSGVGTSAYNFRNYLWQQQMLEEAGYKKTPVSPFHQITHHPVEKV